MVAQSLCPDPELIRDLLCGVLSESEQDEMASHLEVCPDCRQRFEAETMEPEFFGDAARFSTQNGWENETTSLERLLREIPGQLSSVADAASIDSWSTDAVADFLEPSETPEHLGRLGCYEIVDVIGRGGMGIVLRGIDAKLNRVVAIKVLAPELASNPNARRRFFREGQAAAAVSHDHVVTIHAVDDCERLPYLVMEFVKGESLEECVRRTGPMPVEAILRMGRQMALGLAAAHEVGLVHRDMKPANILLENGIQRVRITDFGLARAVDDVAITQTGVVSGTPLYMSPEQASGEAIDHRSDLFSLGSILYTMCTGRPAFRAETTMAVLRRVCEDTPRPIRKINPDIPEWLVEIVDRLIARKPDERIQSAAELAELLGGHLAHLQDPQSVAAPAPVTAGKARRSRPRLLLALLVIVGLSLTEATGVTGVGEYLGVILKLHTPDGTLIVEIEDPNVTVSVDGDEVVIDGAGVKELRLKPGKYQWTAKRNGITESPQWVTIERGGKTVLRVKQLPPAKPAGANPNSGERLASPTLPGIARMAVIRNSPDFVKPATTPGGPETIEIGRPGEEITRQPSYDGVVFHLPQNIRRFYSGQHTHGPGGEHTFEEVPSQLWGQRCTSGIRDGGQIQFTVHRRFHDSGVQRLWLLICDADWETGKSEDGLAFDTHETLSKTGWRKWRSIKSHLLTERERKNELTWSIYYRDVEPETKFTIRTNSRRTPLLVWGSIDLDGIIVDATWDQRVARFEDGASVPLGNGHNIFQEAPEFLQGRLYTQLNGYVGITRFAVTRPQRVTIGLYDWRYSNDGNSSGGWRKELTTSDGLKEAGWSLVERLDAKHSNGNLPGATWHCYSRDCQAGETFAIRNHKYQAPIVFGRPGENRKPPAAESRIKITVPDSATSDPESLLKEKKPDSNIIRLNFERSSTKIAPTQGTPVVYGVGGPTALTSDLPVFFAARAKGRHPDGSVKLVGQLPGVRPGDSVKIARFERSANQLRLILHRSARPAGAGATGSAKTTDGPSIGDPENSDEERMAAYEKFLKESPDHEDLDQVLLAYARHLIDRARREPQPDKAATLRTAARSRLGLARKLFQTELAAAEARWAAFSKFDDREQDSKQYAQRQNAEREYISAEFELATCILVEADTLDERSKERSQRLLEAASAFERIYAEYRSQSAGLYARLWQGRSLQKLRAHTAATGIFHELMRHPGQSDAVRRVQNHALHFLLISQNDLHDDSQVIGRSTAWFESATAKERMTDTASGILWEMARAMLKYAGEQQLIRPPVGLRSRIPWGAAERDLMLESTLELLKKARQAKGRYADLATEYQPRVLALLVEEGTSKQDSAAAQSAYFQVVIPALPPGEYKVEALLVSTDFAVTSVHDQPKPTAVTGQFIVTGLAFASRHLKDLATKAILLEETHEFDRLGTRTQQSTGLDISPLLIGTRQDADLKKFPGENSQYEASCARLGRERKQWALCGILDYPNVDARIYAARELTKLANPDTVPVLLAAAKRNNFGVDGSESATLHSVYRSSLRRALEAATRLSLSPGGLRMQSTRDGRTVTLTSESNPELFQEEVAFDRVEDWLRNVYLADAGAAAPAGLSLDKVESGLIGRTIVDGKDAGVIFQYPHATFFHQKQIPPQILDSTRFEIPLEGYLVVPRDMTVKIWLAGGGVSHDVNWLYVDRTEIGSTGDNRGKSFTYELPLLKGLHRVRWRLTGGTFRTNILVFADPESGELMRLVNPGVASVRHQPEDTIVRVDSNRTGWPIPANWLPDVVQKQIDRSEE